MLNKQKLTIPLTIISLLSLLAIQGYFLKADFLGNKESFKNDVNASLELIIEDVQSDRRFRKHELHKRDLRDSTILRIEYEFNNGTDPSVSLVDVASNDRVMKYNIMGTHNSDTLTKEFLLEKAFGWNEKKALGNGVYFSFGKVIDTRISIYEDTLSVNRPLLDSLLAKNFQTYDIRAKYEVVYFPKDSIYKEEKGAFVSDFFELNGRDGLTQVGVVISKPFWNIVQRSSTVIVASFSAMLLVIFSFWFLTGVIRKQRDLAQAKDDFIDNVTHELLTPISTLHVSLESLDRYNVLDDKEKTKDYLKISKMELSRITGLLQNVLQVSLHNAGVLKLIMTDVMLSSVLDDVIDYYKIKADKPITFEVESFDDVQVHADVYHLNNVLYNLVDNALKYSEREPRKVTFRVQVAEDVTVDVEDNGIGILLEDQYKIFEKFHRVSQKGGYHVKGMGIGLYQSKTIMNKMGGDLSLKGSSDKGSVFSIRLNQSQEPTDV